MRYRQKKGGLIMGGIETAKALMETGKKALDIANELKNVDLKESILELREEILLLIEENMLLKEQLKEKQRYNMVFDIDRYWNILPDGTKDGPYCAACWDYKGKAVHLDQRHSGPFCHVCRGAKNK